MRGRAVLLIFALIIFGVVAASCGKKAPEPGTVPDEARHAGIKKGEAVKYFKAADEDYFHEMDQNMDQNKVGPIALTPDEVKGRNTWIVWTGGNDRFWDGLSKSSFGTLDFLKTLSSYHGQNYKKMKREDYGRHNRWQYLGLVNEPCFEEATGPDHERFGLWLDKRKTGPDCPPDPFENEKNYPGVAIGGRGKTQWQGKTLPVGSYYGYATGIVGLRLFPNPDFDEAAAKKWDPVRYYEDEKYYNSKDLVRPFRVGMSCGFCHVGPNPIKPPDDPENPKWENLSSNVGAQYFWIDRIFAWNADPSSYVYQLFHTSRPGALDTSLVSTDYINNPRTMNAVYNLRARLDRAMLAGKETLAGGGLKNKQFNDYVKEGPLTKFFKSPDTVWTPRVLKDGADSVGALGALNRVYLNIGLFSEEWLLHFNALVGGKPTTPIEVAVAQQQSAYWEATEAQTPNMALFFLNSTAPHKLEDAPGGDAYLTEDRSKLTRGKIVFAERCARCHSSKLPDLESDANPGDHPGPEYLKYWNAYWDYTKTDKFKSAMRDIVLNDKFLEDNFLSSEFRVPVALLETNACSPLATNAIEGNIWDNFSSRTYKDLPPVGEITVHHPITGEQRKYAMPGGGRGYTRPASLVSLWSTAPYLLNNSVGQFKWSGSVKDRMESFDESIREMLWPESRKGNVTCVTASGKSLKGMIDVTTERSYLRIPTGYLPDFLQPLVGVLSRWLPWLFGEGGVEIGPIPKGTPVNLISNMDLDKKEQLLPVIIKLKGALKAIPEGASDEEARKIYNDKKLVDGMLAVSKCPDFIVNRGHYFGSDYFAEEPGLTDDDKNALIEFLKTF